MAVLVGLFLAVVIAKAKSLYTHEKLLLIVIIAVLCSFASC